MWKHTLVVYLVNTSEALVVLFSLQVESLQADNDFTKEQLTNMKTKMEAIKEKDGDNQYIPEFESTGKHSKVN